MDLIKLLGWCFIGAVVLALWLIKKDTDLSVYKEEKDNEK